MIHNLRSNLVQSNDERQLGLVQDRAGVQHVWHERDRVRAPDNVDDVDDHGGVEGGQSLGDYASRRWPREDFDLPRRVDDNVRHFRRRDTLVY